MRWPSTSTAAGGSGRSARTGAHRGQRLVQLRLDRGRITSGYFGLAFGRQTARTGPALLRARRSRVGPFAGTTLGLSQASIEARPRRHSGHGHVQRRSTRRSRCSARAAARRREPTGSPSRSSEPSLEEERQEYLYRAISMGFGLEGVASGATAAQLGDRAMDWLLDEVTVGVKALGRPRQAGHVRRDAWLQRGRVVHDVPMGLRRRLTHRHDHRSDGACTSTGGTRATTCGFRRPTRSATAPSTTCRPGQEARKVTTATISRHHL